MKVGFTPEALTLTLYGRDAYDYGICFMSGERGNFAVEFTDGTDVSFERAVRVPVKSEEHRGMLRNTAVMTLEPDRKYLWRVLDGEACSDTFEVSTSDTDSDELTFGVFADSQDIDNFGEWWQTAWSDAAVRFPDMRLCLHCGDIVDDGSDHSQWVKAAHHNCGFFTSVPILPVTGNHDHMEQAGDVMHRYFNICPPSDKTEPIAYYSVDVGPVHFTMLCSGDYAYTERHGLRAEQIEWAKRDLASTKKKWKVVMIHTPLYSPGKYGSHPNNSSQPRALREQLNALFAEQGVDLVFCGHDHVFSETYPITSDGQADRGTDYVIKRVNGQYYRFAVSPKGPIHIESGCAGNQNRGIEFGDGEIDGGVFRDIVETPYGCVSYLGIRVSGDTLTAEYVQKRVNGGEDVVVRRFGIAKE